tara:strand:- start:520 stop:711 length:192 start_codon:yes stop_codon:yes gene_type:complete
VTLPLQSIVRFALVAFVILGFTACEHAKFRSDESATMPWATPEGFESTAGSPLGGMGGFPGSR